MYFYKIKFDLTILNDSIQIPLSILKADFDPQRAKYAYILDFIADSNTLVEDFLNYDKTCVNETENSLRFKEFYISQMKDKIKGFSLNEYRTKIIYRSSNMDLISKDNIFDKISDSSKCLINNETNNSNFYSMLNEVSSVILNPFILISNITIEKDDIKYMKDSVYLEFNNTTELNENLARRYAILTKPDRVRNLMVDSFLPKYFIKNKWDIENLKETLFNLSTTTAMCHRGFANLLEIKPIPTIDLIEMLGYTKEQIATLLTNVKKKELTMVFMGFGGVGLNTAYWLTEFSIMCNIQSIFKKVYAYDNDTVSLDNLFRMPMPFIGINGLLPSESTITYWNMEGLIENFNKSHISLYKLSLFTNTMEKALSKNRVEKGHYYFNAYRTRYLDYKNADTEKAILYGAPDIESRKGIYNAKKDNPEYISKVFILATHGDNECSLDINPSYDDSYTDFLTESYGIIQLNVFFLNQIRLAISLLETLNKGA